MLDNNYNEKKAGNFELENREEINFNGAFEMALESLEGNHVNLVSTLKKLLLVIERSEIENSRQENLLTANTICEEWLKIIQTLEKTKYLDKDEVDGFKKGVLQVVVFYKNKDSIPIERLNYIIKHQLNKILKNNQHQFKDKKSAENETVIAITNLRRTQESMQRLHSTQPRQLSNEDMLLPWESNFAILASPQFYAPILRLLASEMVTTGVAFVLLSGIPNEGIPNERFARFWLAAGLANILEVASASFTGRRVISNLTRFFTPQAARGDAPITERLNPPVSQNELRNWLSSYQHIMQELPPQNDLARGEIIENQASIETNEEFESVIPETRQSTESDENPRSYKP